MHGKFKLNNRSYPDCDGIIVKFANRSVAILNECCLSCCRRSLHSYPGYLDPQTAWRKR